MDDTFIVSIKKLENLPNSLKEKFEANRHIKDIRNKNDLSKEKIIKKFEKACKKFKFKYFYFSTDGTEENFECGVSKELEKSFNYIIKIGEDPIKWIESHTDIGLIITY